MTHYSVSLRSVWHWADSDDKIIAVSYQPMSVARRYHTTSARAPERPLHPGARPLRCHIVQPVCDTSALVILILMCILITRAPNQSTLFTYFFVKCVGLLQPVNLGFIIFLPANKISLGRIDIIITDNKRYHHDLLRVQITSRWYVHMSV